MIKEIITYVLKIVAAVGALYGLVTFGFVMGEKHAATTCATFTINTYRELEQCKAERDDPHHCVSVCAEEFEKWGC